MLHAENPNPLSYSSSNFSSPPQAQHKIDKNVTCTEPFDHIMENEGQQLVIVDASSTNSTRNERKRLSFSEEDERIATEAVSKKCRINSSTSYDESEEVVQEMKRNEKEEKDHGQNERGKIYGNQESEQREKGEQGDQESEKYEKEEEDNNQEEDEKRKAIKKGKRPVPKYSKFVYGETSYRAEEETKNNSPKDDELNQDNNDDFQDLAILKSISHFYYSNGYVPSPSSNELHNHIMDSIPNLKVLGEELINKIVTLEDKFKTVRELDGDNPDMPRPVDREIFVLSMSIWGNSGYNGDAELNQEFYDMNIQYQEHDLELPEDLKYFIQDFL